MNAPALFMALFNGAWQGALLCLAAFALLRVFRRLNAATRYTVWSALLAISLLLPVANYTFSVQPITHVIKVQTARQLGAVGSTRLSSPSLFSLVNRSGGDRRALPTWHLLPITQPLLYERVLPTLASLAAYAKFALLALLLIALVRLAILGREIVRMIRARKSVRFIEPPFELRDSVRRPYAFAASPGFAMPCVLGFQPALIVIPEALLESGSNKELLSVVLHEHEHVMRFDDVQNVLHRFAGALGFFMPGVWIALRELAMCREQICDDAAIAGVGNRYAYARTLSALAGWIDASPVPVPCFIFRRKQLLRRIEVLLDAAVSHSLRPNIRFAVTAVGVLALVAVLVLRFQVPVYAERIAVEPPKPAVPAKLPRAAMPAVAISHARITVVKVKLVKPAKPAKPAAPKAAVPKAAVPKAAVPKVTIVRVRVRAPRLASFAPFVSVRAPLAPRLPHAHAWVIEARVAATTPHARWGGDLLDALAQSGYNNLSVDDLINLRNHGVSGSLIAGASSFFGHPGVSDLIRLADHGISGSYLAELRAAGVSGLSADDVVRIRDHGVMPMLIAGLRARGYAVTADSLVKLADHGVTILYIDSLQRFRSNGRPSLDDIIRLHDAGFSP